MISVSVWVLLFLVFGFAMLGIAFFWVLQKKNAELKHLRFTVQLISDQEKHDVLRLARLEYDLAKAKEEKEQFLLLQQKFEHDRAHFFKELIERTRDLEISRDFFIAEKNRVREKQDLENEQKMQNLQRLWNEHEQQVVSVLRGLCMKSESFFVSFDNANLPPMWDTAIKPDFLIQYLDQYIVFDAKKSKNSKVYLETQIKATAEKYANHAHIATLVFFVFPEQEIEAFEKRIFLEKGYTFVVLSISALPSTLLLLKRMEALQKLANFNPQERESLLSLLVSYDAHIGLQNAMNLIMTERSFALQEQKKQLPQDFQTELSEKIAHQSSVSFPVVEAKRLAFCSHLQRQRVKKLQEE